MVATQEQQQDGYSFDDYRDNIQRSTTIPHTQIISPKDKTLPFGFFIPTEKAADVEFSFNAPGWTQHVQDFGDTESEGFITTTRTTGNKIFLTDWIRLALVRNTTILAFAPNETGRIVSLGDYYSKTGGLTKWGQLVEDNRGETGYFRATRHLLYFLDESNQPLHTSPLQFKSKGGFGGSFGSELRFFQQEFDRSSFDGALGQNSRWDDETRALGVFAFRLGVRQGTLGNGSKGAWYCHIVERLVPTCKPEAIGKEIVASRKSGGEVKLIGCEWRSLFIPKKSEFGLQIRSDFASYEDFGLVASPKREAQVEVAGADNWEEEDETAPTDDIPW